MNRLFLRSPNNVRTLEQALDSCPEGYAVYRRVFIQERAAILFHMYARSELDKLERPIETAMATRQIYTGQVEAGKYYYLPWEQEATADQLPELHKMLWLDMGWSSTGLADWLNEGQILPRQRRDMIQVLMRQGWLKVLAPQHASKVGEASPLNPDQWLDDVWGNHATRIALSEDGGISSFRELQQLLQIDYLIRMTGETLPILRFTSPN